MNDNRYIKFVFPPPPSAPPRPRLGGFGFLGLVFWALVLVWIFK